MQTSSFTIEARQYWLHVLSRGSCSTRYTYFLRLQVHASNNSSLSAHLGAPLVATHWGGFTFVSKNRSWPPRKDAQQGSLFSYKDPGLR